METNIILKEQPDGSCDGCYFDIETTEFNGCGATRELREESNCDLIHALGNPLEYIWIVEDNK